VTSNALNGEISMSSISGALGTALNDDAYESNSLCHNDIDVEIEILRIPCAMQVGIKGTSSS